MARELIWPNTGAMTNSERNNASPMMTWLGGMLRVARALRTKARTITIRVNAVVSMSNAGMKLRTVSSSSTLIGVAIVSGDSALMRCTNWLISVSDGICAAADSACTGTAIAHSEAMHTMQANLIFTGMLPPNA